MRVRWLKSFNLVDHLRLAGFCLLFLGLALGFYLTFPGDVIKARLISEFETHLPVQVELSKVSLRPLATIAGSGATIHAQRNPKYHLLLDKFSISPAWGSFLRGTPGIKGDVYTSEGQLSFLALNHGAIEVKASDLLIDIPLETAPPTRFSGQITQGDLASIYPLKKGSESQIEIKVTQAALHGLGAFLSEDESLPLGDISMSMTGEGSSFSVNELKIDGESLQLSGTGSLIFIPTAPEKSRVDLTILMEAGTKADPTLVSLLELVGKPRSDGRRQVTINGSLERPVIQ